MTAVDETEVLIRHAGSPQDGPAPTEALKKQSLTWFSLCITLFAALGGFLFGYDTGVVSGAMILIKKEFHLDAFWQELVVSVTIGTAIFGALLGGYFNEQLGRKPILLLSAAIFTAGAVTMGIARSREVLLVGRLTVGFGIGWCHFRELFAFF